MERYSDFEKVGEGSFGSVHRAKCSQTGELVAVKVFHNAGQEVRVFEMQRVQLPGLTRSRSGVRGHASWRHEPYGCMWMHGPTPVACWPCTSEKRLNWEVMGWIANGGCGSG